MILTIGTPSWSVDVYSGGASLSKSPFSVLAAWKNKVTDLVVQQAIHR